MERKMERKKERKKEGRKERKKERKKEKKERKKRKKKRKKKQKERKKDRQTGRKKERKKERKIDSLVHRQESFNSQRKGKEETEREETWNICRSISVFALPWVPQQPTSHKGFLFLKLPPPPCAVLLVWNSNSKWFAPQHIDSTRGLFCLRRLILIAHGRLAPPRNPSMFFRSNTRRKMTTSLWPAPGPRQSPCRVLRRSPMQRCQTDSRSCGMCLPEDLSASS